MFDFLKNATQTRITAPETAPLEIPEETLSPSTDAPATEPAAIDTPVSEPAVTEFTVTESTANTETANTETANTETVTAETATAEIAIAEIAIAETATAETEKYSSIKAYINAHGFSVDFNLSRDYDEVCRPLRELTVYMAKHYRQLSEFLGYLRQRLGADRQVNFPLADLSEEVKAETTNFVKEKLSPYGLLSNTVINGAGYIVGMIPRVKRVTAFLMGEWLEIYARLVVEEEVSRYARELGVGYQIVSNLMISKGSIIHELDVVCQLENGRLCVIETKSGSNFRDYEKLLTVGHDLATIPNYTLLLDANKTAEAAESFRYLYEIYCCNLNPSLLRTQIREMLHKSLEI